MAAVIGTVLTSIVIGFSILLLCGLPLGEFTMGGQHKVFRGKLKILLFTQLLLQIFFVVIILQSGGFMQLWFSYKITKIICVVLAAYLSLNVVMNFISRSKKERYFIGPLSLANAICFWITALKM